MNTKKTDPWITEEYAKERDIKIRELKEEGKDPFTNKYGTGATNAQRIELQKQSIQNALSFNENNLKELDKLGPEAFIKKSIDELKEDITRLENPTPEERYKFTEVYFKDLIEQHKETLKFYENMYKDKSKLKNTTQRYQDHMKNHTRSLRQKLDNIDNLKKDDIDKLNFTELLKMIDNQVSEIGNLLQIPKTKFPNELITPTDKISNMLFNGKLSEELQDLRMERLGSKKELTAKVSIEFDDLENIKLSNRNITPYDREVHDAIVSLYVDGKNEYITPLMVYRTMTGNTKGKLTDKTFNDVSEAIERCSRTRVYIDATDEVNGKGYNMDQPVYKENLLYTRSIKGFHNGEPGEWIQIIETPILYKYANSKNQVARMDIKLLNTPINKNEENIILQGYLYRRINSMKGSNLSRNILYETVYKQLDIKMASAASLRNKQSKIRDTIKNILDYWKEEGFISDFKENTGARNSKISVSIVL